MLVDLGDGPMGITCAHVIDAHRNMIQEFGQQQPGHAKLIFQVGDVMMDPFAQIIDENSALDHATIRFTDEQI